MAKFHQQITIREKMGLGITKGTRKGRKDRIKMNLFEALDNNHVEETEEILEEAPEMDVNKVKDKWGRRPLHYAARDGDLAMSKHLVDVRNADVNIMNKFNQSPMFSAAENGHLNICEFLVEKGADLNLRDSDGNTAFMMAALAGCLKVCQFLEGRGADLNVKDHRYGENAFMYAASLGYLKICQFLEEKGVKLDIQNKEGSTALGIAAQFQCLHVCQYLLEKGCIASEMDKDKLDDALQYICSNGYYDLLKRFCFAGAAMPSCQGIVFCHSVQAQQQIAIEHYIAQDSLRQIIILLMSTKLLKGSAKQSSIKILSVDLIHYLFEVLGGLEFSKEELLY
jgi:ankyrin repeat protein